MKMRKLRHLLSKAGWQYRQNGGSHQIWTNPAAPNQQLTLVGSDNEDVPHYLLAQWKRLPKKQ